jgi:hypothetical protein
MAGLNLGRYMWRVFFSCFRQKQELCLKIGHDHCYMCLELNVRSPPLPCGKCAVRKASLNNFDNSPSVSWLISLSFEARSEIPMLTVSCYLSFWQLKVRSGRRLFYISIALVACLAQFMWEVNEGKHGKSLVTMVAGPRATGKDPEPAHFTFNTRVLHRPLRFPALPFPTHFPTKFCTCIFFVQATCPVHRNMH